MTDQLPISDQEPPQPAQQPLVRRMGTDEGRPASFDAQFRAQNKDVFRERVIQDVLASGDPVERAHAYAERGKPEFVLAYLLVTDLPDAEKRELYARAHDRRAQISDQKANELDRQFHRPFPLVRLEASKDRAIAQRIRAGGALRPGLGRPLPTL
jgi:hypothetical protein